MSTTYQVIGQVIRTKRMARGLSQEVLSGLSGIARSHLSAIERGTKLANLVTIEKIAESLGLSLSDFMMEVALRFAQNDQAGSCGSSSIT